MPKCVSVPKVWTLRLEREDICVPPLLPCHTAPNCEGLLRKEAVTPSTYSKTRYPYPYTPGMAAIVRMNRRMNGLPRALAMLTAPIPSRYTDRWKRQASQECVPTQGMLVPRSRDKAVHRVWAHVDTETRQVKAESWRYRLDPVALAPTYPDRFSPHLKLPTLAIPLDAAPTSQPFHSQQFHEVRWAIHPLHFARPSHYGQSNHWLPFLTCKPEKA
ncbi:hypothetical protein BDP55DRAFT_57551 [Colletotrichum godetiae]|uniref:Uncharacterized protein n=1 Tax=Colletotrichum godetiae TaxID=1209918 RepID=A0AAJ0AR43_9PEZI|nr:uncharacterized protein BDP55DRAFT_57551 [Colletotrichum godetiae]KAK1688142.1 hypothetical protein BDP55DRAFT_57551 [Colletotrichum godetiae]